jgi:hypothetical protein
MAGKTGTTALQTAIQGGKVSDKAAQSALGDAVGRIANLTKRAQHSKEAMMETGTAVLHTAEVQGSLFLASLAEGYLGEDKLKLGSVDLRAPVGLLAQGYGLYQTMNGQKGAGAHVLALGTGVMGSWLANVARNAGHTLAEKRAGTAEPPPAMVTPVGPPAPSVVMQGAPMLPPPSLFPEPGVSGPVREVLLTPEATEGDDELGRRGGRFRRQVRKRVQHRMEQRRENRRERRAERREAREDDEPEEVEPVAVTEGDDFGRRRRRRRFQAPDDEADE